MKTPILSIALIAIFTMFFSCQSDAQNNKKPLKTKATSEIQVIQFHSEHRCVTCLTIEKNTIETVKNFSDVKFKSINVDEEKNEKIAEEFEATGTALYLYNPTTKKKKDLTDFAFLNARSNPEKFKKGLKKEIEDFK